MWSIDTMNPRAKRNTAEQIELSPEVLQQAIRDLLFVGFNSRVVALERDSGRLIWQWKAPQGRSSFVAVLLDVDRLFVSVQGYTYCLDPITGKQLWVNPLDGLGTGLPSLATAGGNTGAAASAAAAAHIAQQQAAAAAAS